MSARDWYIAWIADEATPFDPVAHKRADVPWKELSVSESEGTDTTTVTVTTARMRVADLTGKRWAILSFEHPDGTLYPVARMKRRKLPPGSRDGELALDFDAGLLSDWRDRRDAGLAKLKAGIAFDPILVSSRRQGDPTEILDGHRRIGHFDRVTGAYTTPELLGVGLPRRTFTPADWIGWDSSGGVQASQSGQPLRGVQVTLSASWLQLLQGLLDCTDQIRALFPTLNVGAPSNSKSLFPGFDASQVIASGHIATLTPDELERSWPQVGATIGGGSGYTVVKSSLVRVSNTFFLDGKQPAFVGPVHGNKGRYNYVQKEGEAKPDPADAFALNLDVAYYEAVLVLAYLGRQKREETASFLILNAGCTEPDAPIQNLALKCEDPSVDPTTVVWLPATAYVAADVRRFGYLTWIAQKAHVSTGNFSADVAAGLWQLAKTDQSYLGGPSGSTYLHTARGLRTIYTAVLKATKIIALKQRYAQFEWSVPFEDIVASGFSTAWAARVEGDELDVPGGWAEGKVISLTIRDSAAAGGCARATIRIASCDGTGAAGGVGSQACGYTDEDWDRIALGEFAGYPVPADPQASCQAAVQNTVADQLGFVRALDYQKGVEGRNDPQKNDPKSILRQCPTKVLFAMGPIQGLPALQGVLPLVATAFQGPRQCNLPSL